MTFTQKVHAGYIPPTLQLIAVDNENLVLMSSSATATTENVYEFEIGYDD